ncbi:MAG: ATP/ADP translocase-like protein, partial [bacterium]
NLESMLTSPIGRVRASALQVVVQHAGRSEASRVVELAHAFHERGDVSDRRAVARIIGLPEAPAGLESLLHASLIDPDDGVRQAAMAAAARTGNRAAIPRLLAGLTHRQDRVAAQAALVAWGERIVGTLGDHLLDPNTDSRLRRKIPRVLALIATQDAVNQLMRVPMHQDRRLDLAVLKALNRIRIAPLPLVFPSESVTRQGRALDERIEHGQDRLFRRLALLYPPREIHLAFLGLADARIKTRARAVEYLASTLNPTDRMSVLPLVDLLPDEERVNNAASYFRFRDRTPETALSELIAGSDPWLAACALFVIGESGLSGLLSIAERGIESDEPLVHDTARWATARLAMD